MACCEPRPDIKIRTMNEILLASLIRPISRTSATEIFHMEKENSEVGPMGLGNKSSAQVSSFISRTHLGRSSFGTRLSDPRKSELFRIASESIKLAWLFDLKIWR